LGTTLITQENFLSLTVSEDYKIEYQVKNNCWKVTGKHAFYLGCVYKKPADKRYFWLRSHAIDCNLNATTVQEAFEEAIKTIEDNELLYAKTKYHLWK
jgi:hypothetical protein